MGYPLGSESSISNESWGSRRSLPPTPHPQPQRSNVAGQRSKSHTTSLCDRPPPLWCTDPPSRIPQPLTTDGAPLFISKPGQPSPLKSPSQPTQLRPRALDNRSGQATTRSQSLESMDAVFEELMQNFGATRISVSARVHGSIRPSHSDRQNSMRNTLLMREESSRSVVLDSLDFTATKIFQPISQKPSNTTCPNIEDRLKVLLRQFPSPRIYRGLKRYRQHPPQTIRRP